jgi:hypothetical protein
MAAEEAVLEQLKTGAVDWLPNERCLPPWAGRFHAPTYIRFSDCPYKNKQGGMKMTSRPTARCLQLATEAGESTRVDQVRFATHRLRSPLPTRGWLSLGLG